MGNVEIATTKKDNKKGRGMAELQPDKNSKSKKEASYGRIENYHRRFCYSQKLLAYKRIIH